jgi:histone H3/H4
VAAGVPAHKLTRPRSRRARLAAVTDSSESLGTEAVVGYFRVCSTCRKPIAFRARYYRCSVSTCNRPRTALYFCSLPCWDAHLPEARHRDAWAEEAEAPTQEAFEAERREQELEQTPEVRAMDEKTQRERKIVTPKTNEELPREVLVVVSKLKAYIRARSGMNTSDGVVEVLSDHLRRLCDLAIDNADVDGRKTVLDRDFKFSFKQGP